MFMLKLIRFKVLWVVHNSGTTVRCHYIVVAILWTETLTIIRILDNRNTIGKDLSR